MLNFKLSTKTKIIAFGINIDHLNHFYLKFTGLSHRFSILYTYLLRDWGGGGGGWIHERYTTKLKCDASRNDHF